MPFGLEWSTILWRSGLTLGAMTFGTIVVEHICDIRKIERRPSKYLKKGAEVCTDAWSWVGRQAAWISTWPKHLHLEVFFENAWHIIGPVVKMLISPLWTFNGYFKQITQFYKDYRGTVYTGSAILLLLAAVGYGYFTQFRLLFRLMAAGRQFIRPTELVA